MRNVMLRNYQFFSLAKATYEMYDRLNMCDISIIFERCIFNKIFELT
jgi:hypothetical protein